ncbi:MAG TPA: choice-of-anchor tandem repeat GloVer-containing protein [Verrucomicrobiae bacterium]|jgi:uncharacterized repeat protein (TIGR03803 family)|nr:choice-of-anchor tandem repeat GloVer-containing protein [Verrucomicrobiae bacterium]
MFPNSNYPATGRRIRLVRTAAASTLLMLLVLLSTQLSQAQSYTVIHNFAGQDGAYPFTGLTIDSTGRLYGTTFAGGNNRYGTVFSLAGSTLTTLYNFADGTDGAGPIARVTFGPDGALYGSTSAGGAGTCLAANGYRGCGTVYKLSPPRGPQPGLPAWNATILFRFNETNGAYPQGQLTFDSSGNILGTAVNGGSWGWGLIYELSPSNGGWSQNILYQARNDGDGQYPWGGITLDRSGNLYGVFTGGGPSGWGAVYKLERSGSGWEESTLHGFSFHGDDGAAPQSGLVMDNSGNLYGATVHMSNGGGTAYELNPSGGGWNYDFVYGFSGGIDLGPYDNLVMDAAGNLYGTTFADGRYGYGNVFKLTRTSGGWSYQSLHDFTGGSDGGSPMCQLVFDASGNIYGTASAGGQYHYGVIFKITP